jgi:hypothetical protein
MLNRIYLGLTQALAAAGGFVVLTTFAFGHGAANAIDLGVIIGATILAAAAVLASPSARHRAVVGASTLIGAWTVLVTAGIFAGATQRWLTFAAAVAITGLALVGHTAYELRRSRREVVPERSKDTQPAPQPVRVAA